METIKELDIRGWANKRWTTRKGHECGGKPFNKNNLFKLLTNVLYIGKITHKEEIYEGELKFTREDLIQLKGGGII